MFEGVGTLQTTNITLPSIQDGDKIYKIKVGMGEPLDNELEIKLSKYGTDKPYAALLPKTVSVDKNNSQIIIQFNEPVFEVVEGALAENLLIDLNGIGDFINLPTDSEITVVDDKIFVKSSIVAQLSKSSQFRILTNTIMDSKDRHGHEYTGTLDNANPAIFTSTFIKGELLTSPGGEVEIQLEGINLIDSGDSNGTKVTVFKVGNSKNTIPAVVEGEGNSQKVTFSLPENKSDVSESYIIQVSLDGGRTYSSKFGISDFLMGSKLTSTVLPASQTDTEAPVLSYLTIQSYGTSGGSGEQPDQTHTNVPTLQESKKTLVHVYGANLDQNLTKVRIKDSNGVYWYPVVEPNSDSLDQFIMVAFSNGGVIGNGNTQLLEVICPRNIVGDNTYTYEIAVDGINYNDSITVTATVLDDEKPGKFDNKKELREINVNLLDEQGNKIIDAINKDGSNLENSMTVKGYSWLRYKIVGVSAPEIEGYELVPYQATDASIKSDDIEAVIGDDTEFNFVYRKLKPAIDPVDGEVDENSKPTIDVDEKNETDDSDQPADLENEDRDQADKADDTDTEEKLTATDTNHSTDQVDKLVVKIGDLYVGQTVIKGTATPGAHIFVTIDGKKVAFTLATVANAADNVYETKADENGNWQVTVPALKEGDTVTAVANKEGETATDSKTVPAPDAKVTPAPVNTPAKENKTPELPKTGESSMVVTSLLAALSVLAGFALISKKRKDA